MRRSTTLRAGLLALVLALPAGSIALAQVTSLYYQEVEKDGRIYVFNTPEKYELWSESGDMGIAITLIGQGPNGETIVAENETAADLYAFKHDLPGYARPTPKPAAPSPYPNTKISGRVYADATVKTNEDEGTGVESSDSGAGVDVKRFYFTVNHDFDAVWSAQFQSDIGDQGARRYDVFVKKAFIQAKISPAATFRIGAADTPWVPFVEGLNGYRYIENTLTDRLSFGTSSDWGIHMLGAAAGDKVKYAFAVVNGKTYSNPTRTKSVDFEGRVAFEPVKGLTLALGGYSGKRGNDTDAAPALHTAKRADVLIHYATPKFRIGGEYFQADDWNTITSVATDSSAGWSGWFNVALNPKWSLLGNYQQANPSKDLKPNLEDTYYNLGVQARLNKSFAAALVYKHEEVEGGTLGTSNGTIGSTRANEKGTYDEAGVWFVYDF